MKKTSLGVCWFIALALGILTALSACEWSMDRDIKRLRSADSEERYQAVKRLETTRHKRVVEALIATMTTDANREVRITAVDALGKINDRAALPALVERATHDNEDGVRYGAVMAIGKFRDSGAAAELLALGRTIGRAGETVSPYSLAEALQGIGSPAIEPALKGLTDESPWVRRIAVETLAKIGDQPAKKKAVALLNDPEYMVRREAAKLAKQLGH